MLGPDQTTFGTPNWSADQSDAGSEHEDVNSEDEAGRAKTQEAANISRLVDSLRAYEAATVPLLAGVGSEQRWRNVEHDLAPDATIVRWSEDGVGKLLGDSGLCCTLMDEVLLATRELVDLEAEALAKAALKTTAAESTGSTGEVTEHERKAALSTRYPCALTLTDMRDLDERSHKQVKFLAAERSRMLGWFGFEPNVTGLKETDISILGGNQQDAIGTRGQSQRPEEDALAGVADAGGEDPYVN